MFVHIPRQILSCARSQSPQGSYFPDELYAEDGGLTTSLKNSFRIPTKTDSLSSGFPFDNRLFEKRVTPDEWFLFSSEIVKAATLTLPEDLAAWAAGITTGTLSTGIAVFGGPFIGYYTGRAIHRKTVVKKVKEGLFHEGDLRLILKRWNEEVFKAKGFQAWLELPMVKGEHRVKVGDEQNAEKKSFHEKRKAYKESRRFRILVIPEPVHAGTPVSSTLEMRSTNGLELRSAGGLPPTVEAATYEHNEPSELHSEPSESAPNSAATELPSYGESQFEAKTARV